MNTRSNANSEGFSFSILDRDGALAPSVPRSAAQSVAPSMPLASFVPRAERVRRHRSAASVPVMAFCMVIALVALTGCHATPGQKANANFFTSGSKEADQRAAQRMAQSEQLSGTGEGAGEPGVKKAKVKKSEEGETGAATGSQTNTAAKAEGKLSLYERLGSEAGISNIVADFLPRAMDDPRVNWDRKGVTRGGFSFHAGQSVAWKDTPDNIAKLEQHLTEFLTLATGGPAQYTGKQIESTHADMHITNPEFDAVIGDLKASLDTLQVPNVEQKELLAIIESTRPQIVTER